jgi:hypothetical protein
LRRTSIGQNKGESKVNITEDVVIDKRLKAEGMKRHIYVFEIMRSGPAI